MHVSALIYLHSTIYTRNSRRMIIFYPVYIPTMCGFSHIFLPCDSTAAVLALRMELITVSVK